MPAKTAPPSEPLPIILPRKHWEHVLHCLKSTLGVTPQKLETIQDGLKEPGESPVISISPDGVRWLATEVLRGQPIGEEIFRQWHYWTHLVPRLDTSPECVLFDVYEKVP